MGLSDGEAREKENGVPKHIRWYCRACGREWAYGAAPPPCPQVDGCIQLPPDVVKQNQDALPENDMKYDQDAIPVQLLPVIPLMRIAEVFGYGAEKYAVNSWRRKDARAVSWMRTYGSILRHLMKWAAGEDYDQESLERGKPQKHLAMAATQLMILIEHTETASGRDDRHTNNPSDCPW